MIHASRLTLLTGVIALLPCLTQLTLAYSCCFDPRPPCEAYWAYDAVFVGEVIAIDLKTQTEKTDRYAIVKEEARVTLKITEAFRGVTVAEAEVFTYFNNTSANCGYHFERGGVYLVYAKKSQDYDGKLSTSICTRTQKYSESSSDVIYARSMRKAAADQAKAGGTIFGKAIQQIEGRDRNPDYTLAPLPGVPVLIKGKDQNFNQKTDEDGRYSVSGLPPGDYTVKLDLPIELEPVEEMKARISDHGCAEANFHTRWDGRLTGTVFDADGRPTRVGIYLIKAENRRMEWSLYAASNDDGQYEVKGIQPGRYRILFIHLGLNPQQGDPPTKYFHPGVSDLDQAYILSIGEGQRISEFALRLPALPRQKMLEGMTLSTEGTPLADVVVYYGQPNANLVEMVRSDEQGRFSFNAYEGVKYYVKPVISKDSSEVDNFNWIEFNEEDKKSPLKIVIDPKRPGNSHKIK